jgi:hypothetical protein
MTIVSPTFPIMGTSLAPAGFWWLYFDVVALVAERPSTLGRLFEKGRLYRRDKLHLEWGGTIRLQREGGILTPREVPLIIIVTGE